ncbi:DUF3717 domain-containing protein [Paraburkholderia sp. GAS33]|uniref:DUF3717 domain-containing protein n=1 Tax=Paraburkholderia sp. GAS33 TaxID=3035130 RepID=UPI003D243057
MAAYTIDDFEKAINVWRSRRATGTDGALCSEARLLAKPYTLMFLGKRAIIDSAELSEDVNAALRSALGQSNLPL